MLNDLSYARFVETPGEPTPTDITRYQEAALLVQGMQSRPALTADYQYALWRLFTPSAPVYKSSETLLENAQAAVRDSNPTANAGLYTRLRIYTPAAGFGSNQEFLALTGVPEPSSFWLLATGIGLIALSVVIGWAIQRYRSNRPRVPA